jgi:putative DNA primase/helicase
MNPVRIACPAHGGADANVSLWRDRRGRVRARCWSHGCDEHAILAALGEAASAIASGSSFGNSDPEKSRATARRLWTASRDAQGTLAHEYLQRRGITITTPAALHYHPALAHPTGVFAPAMLAAVEDFSGRFLGVHRTWVLPDGSGKAVVSPQKAALGPIAGGAVRLAPKLAKTLVLAEGIETALSVFQATRLATWATLGTSGLRSIRLPDVVREVIIAIDADEAGELAAQAAARRFNVEGRTVRIARPTGAKDFNEMRTGAVHHE